MGGAAIGVGVDRRSRRLGLLGRAARGGGGWSGRWRGR